ncbi:hypothetical protein, partial [uncultured Brevundimonas sp.]|uniref:hypothetical protein n=1 Tax=uncultured Brevundimonas sp. TaxID=213418 RepID=UPI00260C3923
MKNFVLASLTAAVAMIAAPGIVEAKDTAGTTFRIRARVPVACWVRPDTTVIAQNGASGTVTEACNSPGGYVVQAHYRPLANGESAQIIYGDT